MLVGSCGEIKEFEYLEDWLRFFWGWVVSGGETVSFVLNYLFECDILVLGVLDIKGYVFFRYLFELFIVDYGYIKKSLWLIIIVFGIWISIYLNF